MGVGPVEGDEPGAGQGGEGGGEHGAGLDQDGQPRPHHHRQVARQPAQPPHRDVLDMMTGYYHDPEHHTAPPHLVDVVRDDGLDPGPQHGVEELDEAHQAAAQQQQGEQQQDHTDTNITNVRT